MRKILTSTITLIFAVAMISVVEAKGPKAPEKEFVEEVFVDYKTPTHAGPGPHPTTESDDFALTMGGIRWFENGTVKYKITGGTSDQNTAIVSAEETWDGFVSTRDFARDDGSPSDNPCGGVNEIEWVSIDGEGNVLAATSVCRNVVTKEIVGFRMFFDTDEDWATDESSDKMDVENVASHEWGHVMGLGHTNKPKSGCLTMYNFAEEGETQKRTLGWGDKLGMDVLYATGDTGPGPGCGF